MNARRDAPIGVAEFDALMRVAAPFEPRPAIAVAVSGGADSLALTVLAAAWARRRGGTAVGLTVDHRLRPESGQEARQVRAWLRDREIGHHILRWDGPRPTSGIEAAARDARYALLNEWCWRRGILHLLLGHHRDDQAETFLMRLARGSGPAGLAGMPAVTETSHGRLLRPLLPITAGRLRRTLEVRGQPWIEDPSNDDTAFTRVRIRKSMRQFAAAGLTPDAIATANEKIARMRGDFEATTASFLAETTEIYPTGHGRIAIRRLQRAPRMVALNALAALVTCVGGRAYGPRAERLERLTDAIRDGARFKGRTLSGCLITPRNDQLIVAREPTSSIETIPLVTGTEIVWDGRFRVRVGRSARPLSDLRLGRLGEDGWAQLVGEDATLREIGLPSAARVALPAVRDRRRVVFAPTFPTIRLTRRILPAIEARFSPANALAKSMFSVV